MNAMASERGMRADEIGPREARLLVAAGESRAFRAEAAWQEYRVLSAERVTPLSERRLWPLVHVNLRRLGRPGDEDLEQAYAASAASSAAIFNEAGRALEVLAGAGIPALVLKGLALLGVHYRQMGARPMSDADILVPRQRIEEALDALEAAGWRSAWERAWLRTEAHAGTLRAPGGTFLDLHRSVSYEARFDEAGEAFFKAARPVTISGAPAWAMAPGDQLLHSVVHGLRWSIARSPIWIIDTAVLLRSGGVDPEAVIDRARWLRFEGALRAGLDLAARFTDLGTAGDALRQRLAAQPRSAWQRVEHHFRVREPRGALGALPNLWFAYARSRADFRPPVTGFPAFLRTAWEISDDVPLATVLSRKLFRRLRSAAS